MARPADAQIVPGWNTKQFALERIDADQRPAACARWRSKATPAAANAGPEILRRRSRDEPEDGRTDRAAATSCFQTPTSRIASESAWSSTPRPASAPSPTPWASRSWASADEQQPAACSARSNRTSISTAPSIEKIAADKYRITKGGFTTCVQPTARWEIVSGRATHQPQRLRRDEATPWCSVKNVPVFYLPIMYYPIQEDDRATGFLLPTYSSATWHWARRSATRSSGRSTAATTLTMFHDSLFFTRQHGRRHRISLLARVRTAQGNFRAYWLDQKEAIVNGVHAVRRARRSSSMRAESEPGPAARALAARGQHQLLHRRH